MDKGRYYQLRELQAVIDNPFKTQRSKREAYNVQQDILRQMKDKKLVSLREQLVNAAAAGDEEAEWKIAQQIRDYLKKERMDRYA